MEGRMGVDRQQLAKLTTHRCQRLILAWTFAATLLSCGGPTSVDSIVTTVQLNRVAIEQGQQVQIFVSATNTGSLPVTMFASCALGFRVYASDGVLVSPPNRICLLDGRRLTIRPGATHVDTLIWYGNQSWGRVPQYVEPGTYTIVGGVTANDAFQSESAGLEIEVIPAN